MSRKRKNPPAPQPEDPLGEHVSHTKFRTAFTALAQSVASQNKRPTVVQANPVANSAAARIRDFTRMNPPSFFGSKPDKDPHEFIDQVQPMNMKKSNCNCLSLLPGDCAEKILGFTSPVDVCRFSLVSKSLQSAAVSDSVLEKSLPSDLQSIIATSLSPIPHFPSKKDLYVYLCHHPILIDAGLKSFSLEKWTGKKCYFLGARDLNLPWSDVAQYWNWISRPDSRFPEVAKLNQVWVLDIQGTIRVGVLSPQTSYSAYLVYKFEDVYGFYHRPLVVSVGVSGFQLDQRITFMLPVERRPQQYYHIEDGNWESVYLPSYPQQLLHWQRRHMQGNDASLMQSFVQHPKLRDDGWLEVELGEFFY
ncbi:hypothetical protein BC332_02458 [Capsicum chinense]|nr:hypothetical protein BC332_02458 [Capsicum chinense]